MATKHDLQEWVALALRELGGRATLVAVAKKVWEKHEKELRSSGDLFFTWQYDIRWAANVLRHSGTMKPAEMSPKGVWELAK